MFKGIPKQAFIITIVLVTLIYMGTYMFITYFVESIHHNYYEFEK